MMVFIIRAEHNDTHKETVLKVRALDRATAMTKAAAHLSEGYEIKSCLKAGR